MRNFFMVLLTILLVPYIASAKSNHSIPYDGMKEVSGVAWTSDGYLVVGDSTNDRILQADGSNNRSYPLKTLYSDFESIDSVMINNKPLILILSEDDHVLFEMGGNGEYQFNDLWAENCGRGLEGLAIKKDVVESKATEYLHIAVLWEGGYAQTNQPGQVGCDQGSDSNDYAFPRIATFIWEPGSGIVGTPSVHYMTTPQPGELNDPNNHQKFRATDLVWHGKSLLVLMGSTNVGSRAPYEHTWLQAFCPAANKLAIAHMKPKKLRSNRSGRKTFGGKNWEALDWGKDEEHLVFGNDSNKSKGDLVVYKYTNKHNKDCERNWFNDKNQ